MRTTKFGKTLNTTGVNGLVVNDKQHSSSSQYNKTNLIAAQIQVEDQLTRNFHFMKGIKRRNPEQYIKNPTKTYCLTQGSKDFAFQDMAKESKITAHDKELQEGNKRLYDHLVQPAPKMTKQDYFSIHKKRIHGEESILAMTQNINLDTASFGDLSLLARNKQEEKRSSSLYVEDSRMKPNISP